MGVTTAPLVRLVCAIGCGALAAFQAAVVLAAPSPAPTLDRLLLSPPGANFAEADPSLPGLFEGPFDARGYTRITGSTRAAQGQRTLQQDGFVSGFGRTWVQSGSRIIYVETVIAFAGGGGANSWLRQLELSNKADPTYRHPIAVSGVDPYFGAALFDSTNLFYANAYVFVKGNDAFLVSTVAGSDDKGDMAATQTRRQYDQAPPYTIHPSLWPKAGSAGASSNLHLASGAAAAGAAMVAVIAFLVVRSRRRLAMRAVPEAHTLPPGTVQISPDGRYRWDGETWRPVR